MLKTRLTRQVACLHSIIVFNTVVVSNNEKERKRMKEGEQRRWVGEEENEGIKYSNSAWWLKV